MSLRRFRVALELELEIECSQPEPDQPSDTTLADAIESALKYSTASEAIEEALFNHFDGTVELVGFKLPAHPTPAVAAGTTGDE
jgi:hypothetical protein